MSPVNKWGVSCACECDGVTCGDDLQLPRTLYASFTVSGTIDRCTDVVLSGDIVLEAVFSGDTWLGYWEGYYHDECFCACAPTVRVGKWRIILNCDTALGYPRLIYTFGSIAFADCGDLTPGGTWGNGTCTGQAALDEPLDRPLLETKFAAFGGLFCYPCSQFSTPSDLPRIATGGGVTVTITE